MIRITIKTLDSRNHDFTVEESVTVKELKEQIADSVNVAAESQRLIYCGRVLLDDKKLTDYDVDGKVIHLVQRAPPSSSGGSSSNSGTSSGRSGERGGTRGRLDNAMYLGAMAFPADLMEAQGLAVPPARHTLTHSRLGVARAMVHRAHTVLQELEGHTDPPTDAHPAADAPAAADAAAPAEPGQEINIQAEVTLPIEPNSNASDDPGPGPRADQIAAAAAEAVTAALGHALSVHHAGNVSITVNNGDGNGADDVVVRVTEGRGGTNGTGEDRTALPRHRSRPLAQRTVALAYLVSQLRGVHERMEPYLNRYHNLMRNDPPDFTPESQQVFNQVSELMHLLAHAYHALSDIMCDLSQPPPRVLRCRPVLIQHSAVLQTGIPIQVPQAQIINFSTQPSNNSQMEGGSQPEGQTNANTNGQAQNNSDDSSATDGPASAENQTESNAVAGGDDSTNGSRSEGASGSSGGPTATVSISPSNVEIFMDVSSGAFSLDSVEATVLRASTPPSANNPPPTEQTNQGSSGNGSDQHPWGQPLPSDFIQSLFHRIYGEVSNIHNNNYNNNNNNSSGSGSGASSTTNSRPQSATASGETSSSIPTVIRIPEGDIFRMMQGSGSGGNSQPRAAFTTGETGTSFPLFNTRNEEGGGGGSGGGGGGGGGGGDLFRLLTVGASGSGGNSTSNSQPRATFSRPHIHIGTGPHIQAVDIFDPFLPCNSHHIRGRRRGTGSNGANSTTSSEQPQRPQPPTTESNTNAPAPESPAAAATAASGSSGPSVPTVQMTLLSSGPNRSRNVVHNIIPILPRDIVRNLQAANGGSVSVMRCTVAQLLESIPGQPYTPGQSLIMDFFMTAGRNIMLQDVMCDASPAMLGWMRPGLREYLESSLSVDSNCTEPAIRSAVERINNEVTPFFDTHFEGLTLRRDINLSASVRQVCRTYLPQLIKNIHQAENFTYSVNVSQLVLKLIRGVLGLLAYVSQTTWTNIDAVIFAFACKLVNCETAEVRSWLVGEVAARLHLVIRPVDLIPEVFKSFIVTTISPRLDTTLAMEVDGAEEVAPVAASSPLRERENLPNILIGAEAWHNEVPPDWVPIITRDKERQRRGANQGPLSDAYLAGMPSKRRKLLTDAKPNSSLNKVISESMGRALGAAGLAPSAAADLVEAAACDSGLRNAYKAQVRSTIESTLRCHPDYHPDKYPNTAKYFNNRLHR